MKNTIRSFALVMVLLAVSAASAFAQLVPVGPVRTTLSAAVASSVTNGTQTSIGITSTTGMTASTNSLQSFILVDEELMQVKTLSPFVVARGAGDTKISGHLSGATVLWGYYGVWSSNSGNFGGTPGSIFLQSTTKPVGTCTRTSQGNLPIFNPRLAQSFDCLGGKWVAGTLIDGTPMSARACNVANTGGVYFANGTITTASFQLGVSTVPGTSGNMYISSIFIPTTRLLTGISVLNGTVVGTSLTLVDLMDSTGTVLAKSNTAGISGGTILTTWDIPFGTAIVVVGPARYNFGASSVGGTGAFMLMGAAGALGDVAGRMTAGTFGTTPNLAITTAFTSAQVPQGCGY